MTFPPAAWHQRFQQQARWTIAARQYILDFINIEPSSSILEVGCGTGVVLNEIADHTKSSSFGLDIRFDSTCFASQNSRSINFICSDVTKIPFSSATFFCTLCHYFLMWVKNPLSAIQEMIRVTQPEGYVIAFAEPDYGGGITFPSELAGFVQEQIVDLKQQGADIFAGRQLRHWLITAGLKNVQVGIIGAEWKPNDELFANEIELMKKGGKPSSYDGLENIKDSIYFIPTFYGFGQVK